MVTRLDRFVGWAVREKMWWVGERLHLSIHFDPRDLWIGMFWDHDLGDTDVYICPIPCVVLHVLWQKNRL